MKITVVGAGNAGCMTALQYAWYGRRSDLEIDLIYDPDIKPVAVGQATLLDPPDILYNATGLTWYNNPIHATMKSGILYEDWGKGGELFHEFPMNTMAMHYCPWEMQRHVLESGHFKVTESNVLDPDNVDADYVFDCRGTPDDWTDYRELTNPINACVLGSPNWKVEEKTWSRHVATPDGWTFVIPTDPKSPSHKYCVGYLYNSNITPKEEAEYNMLEMFDVEVTKHLSFKNYVSTKPIKDGRIFKNGNRLFFLEPMESTGVQTYIDWAKIISKSIIENEYGINSALDKFNTYVSENERFVLWHYETGSVYDTPFWDYARQLKLDIDPKFEKYKMECDKISWNDMMSGADKELNYGIWDMVSMKRWVEGIKT